MSRFYKPFPPSHLHSSKALSSEDALTHISAFIDSEMVDLKLQADATLAGDTAPEALAPRIANPDRALALHNLQRLQAALRGQHLEPLPNSGRARTPDATAAVIVPETPVTNGRAKRAPINNDAEGGGDAGEWQDPEEFQRQQQEVEGDVGENITEVAQGTEALKNLNAAEKSLDKKARKEAKKGRLKKEKQEREKARREAK